MQRRSFLKTGALAGSAFLFSRNLPSATTAADDAVKRPRRTDFWVDDPDSKNLPRKGLPSYDPNQFGTDEFVRFCKLCGAEPYLAANVRSLNAYAFDQWIEYCNSPAGSTSWSEVRAAGGSPEPYNVQYWGVGNESWGCGGNFTPEEYASE